MTAYPITASAVIQRNGKWMTTDGAGISLPVGKWNANADVGVVKEILSNGDIIVTVPVEKNISFGTRIYTDVKIPQMYLTK
jgi:hypothetical protein